MTTNADPHHAEREKWRNIRRASPVGIITPGPGQESVWDYPRPPKVEAATRRVRVEFGGRTIADSTRALRVCETSSPPVYYIPQADIALEHVGSSERTSFCEWKGVARYHTIRVGDRVAKAAAWSYPEPDPGFEAIRDHIAFYARRMDGCWVGEDRAEPQPGFFYGGWITPELVGPFKGVPGSEGW